MKELRCIKCNKLLLKYQECKQVEVKCPRCRATNLVLENLPYQGQDQGQQLRRSS